MSNKSVPMSPPVAANRVDLHDDVVINEKWTDALPDGEWAPSGSARVASGTELIFADPPSQAASRFYRVLLLP
ncbi:MAG: hypothetical protein KA191_00140 [Verrucomicrobia bacterium]|nr:hypothetical protein [Verrucomicrobiota bacterium]MDI9381168.1 hypothetical protein [Verrucomicrobiota bacterium]HOA59815.1 hypothetical protein [Verrucomicrobiota bacterium]HOF46655.1 hypothetical protein [Verrucomicrobiota bacterium]HOG85729.1 hypothetical protein [Verrucomicrobiota bacterium]